MCCPDGLALAWGGVPLRGSTLACGSLREGEALIVAKAVSPSRALPLLATPLFCVVEMCVFFRLGSVCCCIGSVGLSRFFCFWCTGKRPAQRACSLGYSGTELLRRPLFRFFFCQMLYMITLPLCLFSYADLLRFFIFYSQPSSCSIFFHSQSFFGSVFRFRYCSIHRPVSKFTDLYNRPTAACPERGSARGKSGLR